MKENNEVMNAKTEETTKKFKTKAEYVEQLKRQFYEIESITEGISEIKEEIKAAGFDATLLVKVAKALATSKADELIEKNEMFSELVEEVRNTY